MTRRSCRLHRRSENAPIQKRKMAKCASEPLKETTYPQQSNRKKAQPLSKRLNEKNQLVLEGVANPCILIETPEKAQPPLPLLSCSWGSPEDVWEKMVCKEQKYTHSKSFLQQHPKVEPRMRSILLDWLLEVSHFYTLHRQTFYLAQDYFDRFMLTQLDVVKGRLQLIGITCLFIASKMEEVYPPKVDELASVTDGAFLECQILKMELVILKALNWNLCPETAVSWLKFYIQMASLNDYSDILKPQFPQEVYVQVTRLLDLCTLNIDSLDFKYRVLAASALCHLTVEKVSGLSWEDIEPCADWMAPFVATVAGFGRVELKDFHKVPSTDRHNIQTHADYMTMLEEARQRVMEFQILTPPSSTEKMSAH